MVSLEASNDDSRTVVIGIAHKAKLGGTDAHRGDPRKSGRCIFAPPLPDQCPEFATGKPTNDSVLVLQHG
jgi:hypothetical protein